jgi:hypothetical protein
MATEITDTFVSEHLRSIRRAQSLSLNDVEIASNGAIKIAHFYGVPVSTLFGASLALGVGAKSRVVIDTRRLRAMTEVETARDQIALQVVLRYVSHIQSSREDWNGEVISLRERDIGYVAICLGYTPTTLIDWLESQKLLLSVRN